MDLFIHRILHGSRANGPGLRNVVWFQGCTLRCPACFNPETHNPAAGHRSSPEAVCRELLSAAHPCDGITISGGEPFQQPAALKKLVTLLAEKNSPPVLVFSGYTETFLRSDPVLSPILNHIDALICGPYREDLPPAYERFCSSGNQELILLSERYSYQDFRDLPLSEIFISPQGTAEFSGIRIGKPGGR